MKSVFQKWFLQNVVKRFRIVDQNFAKMMKNRYVKHFSLNFALILINISRNFVKYSGKYLAFLKFQNFWWILINFAGFWQNWKFDRFLIGIRCEWYGRSPTVSFNPGRCAAGAAKPVRGSGRWAAAARFEALRALPRRGLDEVAAQDVPRAALRLRDSAAFVDEEGLTDGMSRWG